MELGCIFSYINKIGAISNKFLAKRIKEEGTTNTTKSFVIILYTSKGQKSIII